MTYTLPYRGRLTIPEAVMVKPVILDTGIGTLITRILLITIATCAVASQAPAATPPSLTDTETVSRITQEKIARLRMDKNQWEKRLAGAYARLTWRGSEATVEVLRWKPTQTLHGALANARYDAKQVLLDNARIAALLDLDPDIWQARETHLTVKVKVLDLNKLLLIKHVVNGRRHPPP